MGWLAGWLRTTKIGTRFFGDRGERAAERHLRRSGLSIVARQFRSRLGELDLIALDGQCVVFVEVKSRKSNVAGRPEEAVNAAKQKKLTQLALEYLKRRGWLGKRSARFDVVAVTWPDGAAAPEIVHYRNAFEPVGVNGMFS